MFLLAAWHLHHHVPLLPQCFALTLFAFSLYLRQSCRRLALHWCSREATITQTNRWFLLLQGNEELLSAIALSPGCTSSPFATWSIRIFGVCCFVFKVPQKWKWKLCVSWSLQVLMWEVEWVPWSRDASPCWKTPVMQELCGHGGKESHSFPVKTCHSLPKPVNWMPESP